MASIQSHYVDHPNLEFLGPFIKIDDAVKSLGGDKLKLIQLIEKLVRQFKQDELHITQRLRLGDFKSITPLIEKMFRLAAQVGYVDLIEESWRCTVSCKNMQRYESFQSWVNMCMLIDQIDRAVCKYNSPESKK